MGEKRWKIEGEKKDKRKRRNSTKRGSNFSLDFSVISPRIPTRQEAKLIPTARATRGYRYCGVSITLGGRGLLLLGYSLSKKP